ncbi:MAG: Asp-tRNA(Asn)/Glu-tRNA(Gln) amidotransferase subunit GatB [Myxococcota bacterium]
MPAEYEAVIGLEVHAQLRTETKLFCGCLTRFGASPNTQVCEICVGLPGALPVVNEHALHLAVRAGYALGCEVQRKSQFARKNYFYPDLAKGYQISQFDHPLNVGGFLDVALEGPEDKTGGSDVKPDGSAKPHRMQTRRIRINRIHVEEDAAKNIHGAEGRGVTLVDFNRAGVPLIEIVSEPELRSAEEAEAYLRNLREVLVFAGISDGNLEEGSFRCDANVSVRPAGTTKLGTRVELKNINSFRFVRQAIQFEVARQIAQRTAGAEVVQETRTWNERDATTRSMRGKEEAHDYRYFPDPDLPWVAFSTEELDRQHALVPELPQAKRARFVGEFGLTPYDAKVLTAHPGLAHYFDSCMTELRQRLGEVQSKKLGKSLANLMQSELAPKVEYAGSGAEVPLGPAEVAEILIMVEEATISKTMAKKLTLRAIETGLSPKALAEREGFIQVRDEGAIVDLVRQILADNPQQVAQVREGKTKVIGFFVGQTMKAMGGKADPALVQKILRKELSS